ncbi:MAG TPA: efflux RND transporter periplasmic adaptor subunit [bacterium]|nr:efflux RND transporter periplasmic adaptor subunit [bacterium]HPJ71611.1 efflux RND transporter periplasmic adaptor subunit [bacterium]HPQ65815.1 efflux RND transporter periplasmic adaptor subunit [bacterium]
MKTVRLFRAVSSILAPAVLAAAGCSQKQPAPSLPPARVTVATAKQETPALVYSTFGTLVSPASVDIVAQATGKLVAVHFHEGDTVKAGDALFTVETGIYQAQMESAQAQLAQAEAQLKLDTITLERNRGLLAKKLISQQDYDSLQTQVDASQAQRDLAAAQLDQARINREYCSVISPVAGKTGKRLVDPGNVVLADQGPTLVTVKQIDPLYVDFSVSEKYFQELAAQLAKGPLALALVPAGDTASYPGTLSFLNNTVEPSNASFDLRGVVENRDSRLWPGQYVTVTLTYGNVKDAVVVPGDAVQVGQKGPYVFVVDGDHKARMRNPVKLGPTIEDGVIVLDGVKAGETVVTSGQLGLRDGRPIEVIDDQGAQGAQPSPAAAGKTK